MKIIGHRGAAGLAPENTIEAILKGLRSGVDAFEIDVRQTKDGVFVLSHGDKMSGHLISRYDLSHLRKINPMLATLSEAINVSTKALIVIEPKDRRWATELSNFIGRQNISQQSRLRVASFGHKELNKFTKMRGNIKTYAITYLNPYRALFNASRYQLSGIALSLWTVSPFIFWLAARLNLEVIVYTVNSKWLANLLKKQSRSISIVTDRPDSLQFLRDVRAQ